MEERASGIFTTQESNVLKNNLSLEGNVYCLWITSHVNTMAPGTGTKDLTNNSYKVKKGKIVLQI